MEYIRFCILFFIFQLFSANTYSQLWKQYSDSAKKYRDQNNPEQVIDYSIKALKELENDSAESLTYAGFCNSIGNNYLDIEKYREAEPYYLKGKAIREKILGNRDPVYAGSCNNLGILYENLGDFERSVTYHKEALSIREGLSPIKEHPSYALSCNNLAVAYVRMGRYDLAEPYYDQSMKVREKNKDKAPYDYAESCNNLGALYMDIGLYERAEPLYFTALELWGKESINNEECSMVCNNLGLLYLYKGDYNMSESFFQKTLQIDDSISSISTLSHATNLDNMSILQRVIGQYMKAEELLLKSLKIKEDIFKGEDHPALAYSYNNLAGIYRYMHQKEKSENYYLRGIKIREKYLGKLSAAYTLSCDDLASLYASAGELKKAKPLFLEAYNIRKKILKKNHFELSTSCNNLGNLYKDMGELKKAEQFFTEAKKIRKTSLGKEHPMYADLCYEFAALYRVMHNPEKARKLYKEAFQSDTIQLKRFFSFTSESEKQTYIQKNNANKNALLSYLYEKDGISDPGLCYNVTLSNRNIILTSSWLLNNRILTSTDTTIINKYNSWMEYKKQISHWYSKPVEKRPIYLPDLEEKANTVEKDLTRLSSAFNKGKTENEISWKKIQQSLKSNEASVEFGEFGYYDGNRWTDSTYTIALLIRKDKPEPILIRLFERKQLDRLLAANQDAGTESRINSLYSNTPALYKLIWKPIEKNLSGITKIYFAPAGNLFKLSFAAIKINDKQVLGDKYQLVQFNTTATVVDNPTHFITATDKIQLYGAIQYNADSSELKDVVKNFHKEKGITRSLPEDMTRSGNWNYLPGTVKEITEIENAGRQKGFTTQLVSGLKATEESVKALTGKASPAILHIATHGFFFPDPKENKEDNSNNSGKAFKQSDNPLFRSGLILAGANNAWQGNPIKGFEDGILTAYEVSNLYLPDTKLVVLSACETALGDIHGSEGVYGLQRAFKMAGVQNLVMSLWQVGDKETAEFMQLFYKNLFNSQTVNDAFFNAQTIMKNKYRNEPYKWAAWVLVR